MKNFYEATADELTSRILKLIEINPVVLQLNDPWGLFKLGLKCDDLQPTLFQASFALSKAKAIWEHDHANT